MALTLLQMVNAAQARLGLPQTTTVAGSSDKTALQLFALANDVLDELRQMNRWTALQAEYDLAIDVPIITTGDVVENSAVITNIPSTAGLTAQFFSIAANTVPTAARVQSVDSATQVTMTMEATGTEGGTTIAFGQDTYPLPPDFDYYNNQTFWDRINHWALLGPDSPQTDQWHRSGIFTTGPRRHFRQVGDLENVFRIWPPPFELVNPLQFAFEYLSIYAVAVHGVVGNFAQYFVNDNDTTVLNSQAVIQGLMWKFWEIKGFGSYVTMQTRWIDYVNRLAARDGGAKTLSLARRPDSFLLSSYQVQDGNWPGNT